MEKGCTTVGEGLFFGTWQVVDKLRSANWVCTTDLSIHSADSSCGFCEPVGFFAFNLVVAFVSKLVDCTDYNLILFANLGTYNLIVVTAVIMIGDVLRKVFPCNFHHLFFLRQPGNPIVSQGTYRPSRHRL